MNVSVAVRLGRERGKFQRVIRHAQIARRHIGKVLISRLVHVEQHIAEASFSIRRRLFQGVFNIRFTEFFKLEHAATGNDCGRHRRIRVFRSGTDKDDIPALYGRQKRIGLRFVETVAFVEQKIGALAVEFQILPRLFHRRLDVGNPRVDGVELNVVSARGICNDIGERGLARTRRAPEDTAAKPVRFNCAGQQAGFRNDMFLPDKFFERARPHALCKRLHGIFIQFSIIIE